LLRLYGDILVPREVYNEVVVNGLRLGAADARAIDFLIQQGHIRIVDVTLPSLLPDWALSIDIGEVEVITLATQHDVDWVLIDDLHARKAARRVGLPIKGTVGILLSARRQGHLSLQEFELLMQGIKAQPALWISASLCDRALARARQESE
jgi:predicted nucleic acid-binding protein